MNKTLVFGLLALGSTVNAQIISSSKWSDVFSYDNVLAIRDTGEGKLIAATENGIFYYTPKTGEISKLSKANGLHEVKISAFDYNPETKTGLVGYVNGSMDVITPEGITYIVDIPIATGYTGSKKINHISITGNQVAVSVGYGVSVFNLDKKEFGDTAFFNTNGIYEPAIESAIKDKTVYSITASGLKKHDMNVTFPIYSEWQTVASGTFTNIDVDGSTIAYSNDNQAWSGDGTVFTSLGSFSGIKDVVVNGSYTTITMSSTTSGAAYVYNGTSQTANTTFDKALNTGFFNGQLFAGSRYDGILDAASKPFKPNGPFNNTSYKINLLDDKIWVSTGARKDRYNGPLIHPDNLGFYFFNGLEWIYPSFFRNNATPFNILDAIGNPLDFTETFVANYSIATGQGFYKFQYDNASKDFDLVKFYPTDSNIYLNRPVGFAFDDKNNLFATLSFSDFSALASTAYYDRVSDMFVFKALSGSQAANKPLFYEDRLWIPLPRANYLAVQDINKSPNNLTDDVLYLISGDNGLPANGRGTISIAIDKNGDAWIGDDLGLRVLYNASEAIINSPKTEEIIIQQDGTSEELFKDSSILQIEIDSSNYKWISVEGGGVYYLSPNGQKSLFHFTKENSPLPTNTVTDIKVDTKTGKVYFVTFEGIVTYQSDIVNVTENFSDVMVYPNPVVYSLYKGNVHLKGLAEKTNIRIVDAAGNLVHQAVALGGVYEWDLTNKGKRVASGVYFVLMTNADGTDKATAKIAVVN